MKEVKVPDLEKIEEMTLTEWKVEEGGGVRAGQEVAEMEALKTSFSIEAPIDGLLEKKLLDRGEKAGPGETIAKICRS